LAEVVEGWWKAHVVTLEDNTRQAYRIVWARHIQPALGGVKIRSLTPGRVDAFRQYLEEAGVGEPTVAKALAIVSGACRFAVLRGLVDANPVRDVRKPKPGASDLVGLLHPLRSRGSGWNCWLLSVSEMPCLSRRWHTRVCGPAKPERCVGRMYGQVRSWSNEP
jgi:hypothetical protein